MKADGNLPASFHIYFPNQLVSPEVSQPDSIRLISTRQKCGRQCGWYGRAQRPHHSGSLARCWKTRLT